jgi:pre-mRNA-splicing factor 38A
VHRYTQAIDIIVGTFFNQRYAMYELRSSSSSSSVACYEGTLTYSNLPLLLLRANKRKRSFTLGKMMNELYDAPDVNSVHGRHPQFLIEKIIRSRIFESAYWKEHCFALSSATVLDKAVELKNIGGCYSNQRPTEFLCLTLKLLQLQPEKEILLEFIKNEDFKYVRALGAYYLRLIGNAVEIYQYLEPLLYDYRKLKYRRAGKWA